ncbi:ABC transporter substrate-binding protein [Marinisporobacter balticus]|uniref:Putative ABC transport system substrate-binding protein n=1 Tax=Marinisporobacter balticus TaxID=2018667 RepID=A0A4R2KBZ9_9FIRM|nr:ABC transporter substrate-binding protein [Marinisporobacter balticus]TCO71041.1 putative ABC transport system substrate-binding protein [Marinisporobacter balticus]
MVGKKALKKVLLLMVGLLLLIGCAQESVPVKAEKGNEEKVIKLGITQIVEHPALDAARKGFIDALESEGLKDGEKVVIDFQNAQGDMPTAQTIAQNFVSQEKDMILAIATPTAQAAFNATKEIPIIITAVTDPKEAGLVESWEMSGTNVTGTSDLAPVKKQFELLKKLVPNGKKVGIIYNTSEINSEIQITRAKKIASEFGLEIITTGVTNVNEVPQVLNELIGKIDVLYTPTDNLVASSMPLIAAECMEKQIPVIGAEKAHIEGGALATEGIDYYKLGFQTGLTAVKVINGKNPKDMSIETLKETQLVINTDTLKALNIVLPNDLKEKAEWVGGEK